MSLPSSAKIIIIGGGIVGCSVAYHLGRMGMTDVLLLERGRLTSGTTWHAAGLVGQLRASAGVTQLLSYSVSLYDRLERETGLATGWKRNGGLRLACNDERWVEVKRQATTANSFGLDMQLLTPQEAYRLWPLMQIDDVVGAAFLPTDGQASPSDIAMSLAKGARQSGVTVVEGARVTGIDAEGGRVRSITTSDGHIVACDKLVICAGLWSREVGRMAGVNIPIVPVQHQYLITERIDGVTSGLPTLRDPDRLTYWKEEVGGLVMGGYEPNPKPWATDPALPERFEFQLLDNDLDHFEPLLQLAAGRVPAMQTAGIKRFINGPESFTPDGNFILGEAPEARGVFVGTGFNAFGIAAGGGAGMVLAEWIVRGEPPYDLWPVDIRRFGRNHLDADWVRTRTLEAYAKHYAVSWPFEEFRSGRPLRRSPLYDRLKARGACFGEKLGWERPNWFAAEGEVPQDVYSYRRQNWFEAVGREHTACRERVAVFDQTSFAKALLVGRDAEQALSWIAANDVAQPPGHLVYTQMLNARGGIECDLTVARLSDTEYYIVTGTGFATHDFTWISRSVPEGLEARLVDVTSAYAVLSVMGPRSRDVLQSLTRGDLSDTGFPFGRARWITLGNAPMLALRVSYVGELGWELHIPVEFAAGVYDAVMAAGEPYGIANAGYRAIESLRLEKGYRAWGAEIGPDHSPLVAGLKWATKLGSVIPFQGRAALESQAAKRLPRFLAGFTADPEVILLGRETIYRDGRRVGWLASGGYGYTVGRSIGFGYVHDDQNGADPATLLCGRYELEVASERVPAQVFFRPLYDPSMSRMKG